MVEIKLKNSNLHTSYWGIKIIEAEARGSFTDEDKFLAMRWNNDHCCGTRTLEIPRSEVGVPKDYKLETTGWPFSRAVRDNKFEAAVDSLIAIEARAAEVLENLNAKN